MYFFKKSLSNNLNAESKLLKWSDPSVSERYISLSAVVLLYPINSRPFAFLNTFIIRMYIFPEMKTDVKRFAYAWILHSCEYAAPWWPNTKNPARLSTLDFSKTSR